jgi:hypothetical protein
VIARLLDPAFGFFVWSAHFLIVYVATALSCALGLGTASAGAGSTFLMTLTLVPVDAAVVLAAHAILRYRRLGSLLDQRFWVALTVGGDAIATAAIVLQLLPLRLVPLCA